MYVTYGTVRYVKLSTLAGKINDSMCTPSHSHHITYPSRTHIQAIRIPIQSEPKLKTCPVTQGSQSKAKQSKGIVRFKRSPSFSLSLSLSLNE